MATMAELEKKVAALTQEVALLRARTDIDSVYVLSDEERKEVRNGLREVEKGDIATDEEVAAIFKKHGL